MPKFRSARNSSRASVLFQEASVILKKLNNGGSFNSLIFNNWIRDPQGLTALVSKACQYRSLIDRVITSTQLLNLEPNLDVWLLRILIAHLCFGGKQRITGESQTAKTVLKFRKEIEEAVVKEDKHGLRSLNCVKAGKPRYVRVNTLKTTTEEFISSLKNAGYGEIQCPNNYEQFLQLVKDVMVERQTSEIFMRDYHIRDMLVFPKDTFFQNHPAYQDGRIVLQDKASCLQSCCVRPPPGSIVLDMCAAPGMKTSLYAAVIQNTGKIYAIERSEFRYKELQNVLKTFGATCVTTINNDAGLIGPETCENVEYIIVDPSCSGSGMSGRAKLEDLELQFGPKTQSSSNKPDQRVQKLQNLQTYLLKHALSNFPRARCVVYSTCSMDAQENEAVVENCLNCARLNNFGVVDLSTRLRGWSNFGHPDFQYGERTVYTKEADYMNGGFFAVFERGLEVERRMVVEEEDEEEEEEEENEEWGTEDEMAVLLAVQLLDLQQGNTVLNLSNSSCIKHTTNSMLMNLESFGKIYIVKDDQMNGNFEEKFGEGVVVKKMAALETSAANCPGVEGVLVFPESSGSSPTTTPLSSEDLLKNFVSKQFQLLRHALTTFPQAKRVIYTTSSALPQENEEIVDALLVVAKFHGYHLVDTALRAVSENFRSDLLQKWANSHLGIGCKRDTTKILEKFYEDISRKCQNPEKFHKDLSRKHQNPQPSMLHCAEKCLIIRNKRRKGLFVAVFERVDDAKGLNPVKEGNLKGRVEGDADGKVEDLGKRKGVPKSEHGGKKRKLKGTDESSGCQEGLGSDSEPNLGLNSPVLYGNLGEESQEFMDFEGVSRSSLVTMNVEFEENFVTNDHKSMDLEDGTRSSIGANNLEFGGNSCNKSQESMDMEDVSGSELKVLDPGSKVLDPVPKVLDPGSKILNPKLEVFNPVSRVLDPGSKVLNPLSKSLNPESNVLNPGSKVLDPGSEVFNPVSRVLDPGSKALNPGSKVLDPVSKALNTGIKLRNPEPVIVESVSANLEFFFIDRDGKICNQDGTMRNSDGSIDGTLQVTGKNQEKIQLMKEEEEIQVIKEKKKEKEEILLITDEEEGEESVVIKEKKKKKRKKEDILVIKEEKEEEDIQVIKEEKKKKRKGEIQTIKEEKEEEEEILVTKEKKKNKQKEKEIPVIKEEEEEEEEIQVTKENKKKKQKEKEILVIKEEEEAEIQLAEEEKKEEEIQVMKKEKEEEKEEEEEEIPVTVEKEVKEEIPVMKEEIQVREEEKKEKEIHRKREWEWKKMEEMLKRRKERNERRKIRRKEGRAESRQKKARLLQSLAREEQREKLMTQEERDAEWERKLMYERREKLLARERIKAELNKNGKRVMGSSEMKRTSKQYAEERRRRKLKKIVKSKANLKAENKRKRKMESEKREANLRANGGMGMNVATKENSAENLLSSRNNQNLASMKVENSLLNASRLKSDISMIDRKVRMEGCAKGNSDDFRCERGGGGGGGVKDEDRMGEWGRRNRGKGGNEKKKKNNNKRSENLVRLNPDRYQPRLDSKDYIQFLQKLKAANLKSSDKSYW